MASAEPTSNNHDTLHDGDTSDVIINLPNGVAVRRFRKSDAESSARSGNNPKVWANLRNRMPQPYTEKDAAEWIERNQNSDNFVPSGAWTLETGSQGPKIPNAYTITVNDKSVGSIGILFNDPTDAHVRTAEIGYWLGEEHWGRGIMSAVLPAFVKWAWKTFDVLVRLHAETYDRNVSSRKVLEKAGFRLEGVMKCAYLKNGVVGDLNILGITRPGVEKA